MDHRACSADEVLRLVAVNLAFLMLQHSTPRGVLLTLVAAGIPPRRRAKLRGATSDGGLAMPEVVPGVDVFAL